MLGSPFAGAHRGAGRGYQLGHGHSVADASARDPHQDRRAAAVGADPVRPGESTHGTQNLVGALRQSMAALGARTIREMHEVEMVVAPSIATEGKSWQLGGRE